MLPKHHLLLGIIFAVILYIFGSPIYGCILILLVSVLVDIDHYLFYINKTKDFSLIHAYKKHLKLPEHHKPVMHIFHTLEFHILVLILSFFYFPLIYIFLGLALHSLTDIIDMSIDKTNHTREYFFIRYLLKNKTSYLQRF